MCLEPTKIADVGFVACRKCWQCQERKVDDWVGRNIAESKTATASNFITLTYGRDLTLGTIDHLRAAVLTYSDVQKYLKLLRRHGFPMRYFVVGEHGSRKGRAHWHIVIYWQGEVPPYELRENFMEDHWPHGWSYWDEVGPATVRYACKYLAKDFDDPAKQVFGPIPSRMPPLGDEYFRRLAAQYVEAGLPLQNLFYSFPEVRRVPHGTRAKTAKGLRDSARPIQFRLSGTSAENYCRYYVEGWRERYGDDPPASELIWEFHHRGLKRYLESVAQPTFNGRAFVVKPLAPPPGGTPIRQSETDNCWVSDVGQTRLYFLRDDEGEWTWREKGKTQAEAQPATASDRYRKRSCGE
ncbi:hypothetical protein [Aquibium sp. ELW1220]|uniref:rolling circle replication-associated protein n=1 Tax=Aquibium sp. ELW1220 TaxID=2976766 RepID=UPI0025AF4056|nr:hypothetical protein [Aquibium sp. ELW1220]MDN2583395.1 hypothetical protein [Aquibium sp. ELW1220]